MDADLALLARLVGDIDRFAAEHWGQRSTARSSGTPFDDLLTVDAIEALLAATARRPTFRLVRDGVTLGPERSTRPVRLGGRALDDVADLAKIATAVDDGATLVLQGLQRTSLRLAEVCRSLERATSHPVQANAYLTPAGSAGLARHQDDHDVLVLQVVGAKSWAVEDLGPVCTQRGDVLYIPAGVRHEAAAQDGPSLHLTLGLLRITHGHVLRRALRQVEALERPLPLGYARPEHARAVAADIRGALEVAASTLGATDAAGVAAREVERAHQRRAPLPLGQLRSILALDRLDARSQVTRRLDQPAVLVDEGRDDGRLTLRLVDRRLHLPTACRAALEHLLAHTTVAVGALPGLDETGRVVLAKRLVREGLLTVAGG